MNRSINSKQKIANALKTLLENKKFSEISVCSICAQANTSRKVFYKYFKDKYDLAYFLYERDFDNTNPNEKSSFSSFYRNSVVYFYNNRKLYKKLFTISEQNCFSETFHESVRCGLEQDKHLLTFSDISERDFAVSFFADALILSLRKWITLDEPERPELYLKKLTTLFEPITKIDTTNKNRTL